MMLFVVFLLLGLSAAVRVCYEISERLFVLTCTVRVWRLDKVSDSANAGRTCAYRATHPSLMASVPTIQKGSASLTGE